MTVPTARRATGADPAVAGPVGVVPAVVWRRYLAPHRRALAVACLLTLAETALDLVAPWPLRVVADNVVGRRPLTGPLAPLSALAPVGLALLAAAVMVAAAAMSAVVTYVCVRLVRTTGERVGAQLRADALGSLLERDATFHGRHRSAELLSRLTGDVGRVQDALVAWADVVVPQVLTLLGMLGVVLWVDPVLGGLALLVCGPLAGLTVLRRRLVRNAEGTSRQQAGRLATTTSDLLRHVRAVQVFGRQDQARAAFAVRNEAALGAAVAATELEARFAPVADVVLTAGSAMVLAVGAGRVVQGQLSLGTLLVLLAYVAGLYAPVRSLARLGSTFARGRAGRDRLGELLVAPREAAPAGPPARVGRLQQGIEFRDVAFAYPGGPPVLDRLELLLPAGQVVCVVGPSGAGKSTLLALLLRLYEPGRGQVLFDGVDLARTDPRQLREQIAFVPQDAWLLDGTLADNIRFGWAGATDAEIAAAADAAQLSGLLARSPAGLATLVGDGGTALSGGERRRVSLARALLRPGSLLLLDEPTSGLDAETEAALLPVLRAAGCGRTVVVVTHRLALAESADLVVVLDRGRVAESGRPADLRATGGAYRRLLDLQVGAQPEPVRSR